MRSSIIISEPSHQREAESGAYGDTDCDEKCFHSFGYTREIIPHQCISDAICECDSRHKKHDGTDDDGILVGFKRDELCEDRYKNRYQCATDDIDEDGIEFDFPCHELKEPDGNAYEEG